MGIDEYIFLATLDKRTCHGCGDEKRKSCAELDGKVFKISEAKVGVNKHPMHPYCRCTDMPNTGKTIKRAARDERGKTIFVPSDMTYSQWYGKYVGENGIDNGGKNSIIEKREENTYGALYRYSERADKHAHQFYDSVRKMKTDCERIATNTGFDVDDIKKIKSYIFVEKHRLLDGEWDRFAPSYEIAETWQRLMDGKCIKSHDITLLKHELMERELVLSGVFQDEAHVITSRIYNYQKECAEYYAEISKH